MDLAAKAYDEAQRLIETAFSFHNPYSCVIEADGIPYDLRESFYRKVEEELLLKGEKITRQGEFFKIEKYQKK